MSQGKHIVIVGAAPGSIGHWLAAKVFAPMPGVTVTLADLPAREDALARAAKEMGQSVRAEPVRYDRDPPLKALASADVLAICVPLSEVERVASAMVPRLRPGALVFDTVSEKVEPLRTIERHLPAGVSLVGTHPLFGPKVTDPAGQVVVVCPVRTEDQAAVDWLREVFERAGLRVVEMSPEAHDEAMLPVQVLTHFTLLVFARTLAELRRRLERWRELGDDALWQCTTPPFSALLSFACRMLASPPRTYAQIQKLRGADMVRELFAQAAAEVAQHISEGKDLTEIMDVFADAGDQFFRRALEYGTALSAIQVAALQEYFAALARARSEGRLVVVAVRDGEQVRHHAGVVLDVGPRTLTLEQRRAQVPVAVDDGQVRLAPKDRQPTATRLLIAYDEISEQACRRRGVNPRREVIEIHHRRAVVLGPDDVRRWRAENLLPWYRDVVVRVPAASDQALKDAAHAATQILSHAHPDIVAARVIRTDTAPDGRRELIVRLEIFGDRLPEAATEAARRLLDALGLS